MSQSVNKMLLIGRLTADPELRYTPTGRAVCNMRIATDQSYKNKDGVLVKNVEYHRVTIWGERGENCGKYLAKGRLVHVEGPLKTRSYEKDGQKHFVTEIIASNVQFLDRAPKKDESGAVKNQVADESPMNTDIPY